MAGLETALDAPRGRIHAGRLSHTEPYQQYPADLDLCHDACVELDNVLWMLTALAAVVVLLTRMRLSATGRQPGHAQIPGSILNAHTVLGVTALAVWIFYLTSPSDVLGIVALVVWWIEVVVGILILARWLPGAGRHAAPAVDDSWAEGPYLSILGHVGLLLGVIFFTYCVLAGKVG
jgi:hypothetical protein